MSILHESVHKRKQAITLNSILRVEGECLGTVSGGEKSEHALYFSFNCLHMTWPTGVSSYRCQYFLEGYLAFQMNEVCEFLLYPYVGFPCMMACQTCVNCSLFAVSF